jgi:hypothetical protein
MAPVQRDKEVGKIAAKRTGQAVTEQAVDKHIASDGSASL